MNCARSGNQTATSLCLHGQLHYKILLVNNSAQMAQSKWGLITLKMILKWHPAEGQKDSQLKK